MPAGRHIGKPTRASVLSGKGNPSPRPRRRDGEEGEKAESGRSLLARHGFRNATSLVAGYRGIRDAQQKEAIAAILPGEKGSRVVSIIEAVTTQPNFQLVCRWKDLGWVRQIG